MKTRFGGAIPNEEILSKTSEDTVCEATAVKLEEYETKPPPHLSGAPALSGKPLKDPHLPTCILPVLTLLGREGHKQEDPHWLGEAHLSQPQS